MIPFIHQKFWRKTFIFVPWLVFWNHGGALIPDQSLIRLKLTSSEKCESIGFTVLVRAARTLESREKGYQGRIKPLEEGEGLAFIWDMPVLPNFWMKET